MYRYMIEHPEWLPPEGRAELMPHYRAGDDRGRIYRVFPPAIARRCPNASTNYPSRNSSPPWIPPTGWQRDKIQQMLVWQQDPAAAPLLEKLATIGLGGQAALLPLPREMAGVRGNFRVADLPPPRPSARLHALCTLDGLHALKPDLIERALSDPHPGIRINALRLAEPRLTPAILAAAAKLVDDPDPKVRLQLACTLGEWKDHRAGQALGRLAVANHGDKFILAAVMSSAVPHCLALVAAAVSAGGSALASLSDPCWICPLPWTNATPSPACSSPL